VNSRGRDEDRYSRLLGEVERSDRAV